MRLMPAAACGPVLMLLLLLPPGAARAQQCRANAECIPEDYCAKQDGDCDGEGSCTPRPDICPPLWDPICGCDGQTYANSCVAAVAGVNVDTWGECVTCWSNDDCAGMEYCLFQVCAAETGICMARPMTCPNIWEPVCGCDAATHQSPCHAALAGISVDHEGPCPTDRCTHNSMCPPDEYCARQVGDCDGEGACLVRPLDCLAVWDPVCGCDGVTYGNDCFAARDGVSVLVPGECTHVYRGTVPLLTSGWKASALPLTEACDDETPPFPWLTAVPGAATDALASGEALVLYRVLRSGTLPTGARLAASKAAGGVELTY